MIYENEKITLERFVSVFVIDTAENVLEPFWSETNKRKLEIQQQQQHQQLQKYLVSFLWSVL